jgi:hypothetical protein
MSNKKSVVAAAVRGVARERHTTALTLLRFTPTPKKTCTPYWIAVALKIQEIADDDGEKAALIDRFVHLWQDHCLARTGGGQ